MIFASLRKIIQRILLHEHAKSRGTSLRADLDKEDDANAQDETGFTG